MCVCVCVCVRARVCVCGCVCIHCVNALGNGLNVSFFSYW